MPKITTACLCFFLLCIGCCAFGANVLTDKTDNLHGKWMFRTDPYEVGESQNWQALSYDDSKWKRIQVPGCWEAQGITDLRPGQTSRPKNGAQWSDYDGVAWYRLRFVVPKSWAGMLLVVFMSSVDDMDRTYFNGKLIGQTGPQVANPVLVGRKYTIEPSLVGPGKENVLAVRVYDGGGPGGITGSTVFALPVKLIKKGKKLPGPNRPLIDQFSNPAADSRILKIIHSWPDEADAQQLLIYSLISDGFGGVVSNVSFNDYLKSQDRWSDFVRAIQYAKDSGMSLWVYDERGYPSGTAGGLTLQGHPEWEVRGLLVNDATVEKGRATLKVPTGNLIHAYAYPEQNGEIDTAKPIDLSKYISNGTLDWQAPEGRYKVILISEDRLYDHTFNAYSLGDKLPYINLLMPEPTRRFIELTHQAYADHLGDNLGKWFVATFTDEPSLMNRFVSGSQFRGLPWAPNLPAEFLARRGYDIMPLLPVLAADSGPRGKKVRYDFWKTVGELVSENYFGQIQQFCRDHAFASGGHLIQEEPILDHVACYGNFFQCVRRLDAPSIDCLTSNPSEVPWQIARLISSVAELQGNPVTMCETSDFAQVYRPETDNRPVQNVTEEEIRGTCNRLLLGGITTITSYYTFNQISAEQLRRLNNWVGRCSTMLRGGYRASDIALLYPIESIWPDFIPARNGTTDVPSANRISQIYDAAAAVLYAANRDFSYIDRQALDSSDIHRGSLAHDKLAWKVLILPGIDTLPLASWQKIAEFYRSGGAVIAIGALPTNTDAEYPSKEVAELARQIFQQPQGISISTNPAGGTAIYIPKGSEPMLPDILDLILEKDITIPDTQTPIRTTHRAINGYHVYFAINDSAGTWKGSIGLPTVGSGEMWDPATGKVKAVRSGKRIDLELSKYSATIFRFKSIKAPQRLLPDKDKLPRLEFIATPAVTPTAAGGEFVETQVTADPENSRQDAPAWYTSARILKSNVDTFSMLTFAYPKPMDWSKADCISIETWNQQRLGPSPQLLMFVRDKNGAEYYAQVGISLASEGYNQAIVPINCLQPTPWAAVKKQIDWRSVNCVVIGWGGYFGTQGESIAYSLASPKIGKIGR